MVTLAFDSVAKVASVAVCDKGRLLAQYNIDNGLTQSELLLPMAEDVLRALKLSFSDVELLACTTGPGSFTGVRIGVSLVKGLAFGRDIPCVGVSALEALAENLSGISGIVVPCMDARRGQVYAAIFRSQGGVMTRLCDDLAISLEELSGRLREFDEPIYLCGDGYEVARAALDRAGVLHETTPTLLIAENAYSCARLAEKKYAAGEYVSNLEIAPTYLRMPQAERERLEKEKLENRG